MDIDEEYIYYKLNEKGLIGYGKFIEKSVLENEIGCKEDPRNPWNFLNPLLKLKDYIEEQGFFCKCKNGSLRILPIQEMTNRCERIENNYRKRCKKAVLSMRNAQIDALEDELQKAHYHCLHKMSLILQSSKNVLKDL